MFCYRDERMEADPPWTQCVYRVFSGHADLLYNAIDDTFQEFARPLMQKLKFPTLFCHELEVVDNSIRAIKLRLPDHKRKSVQYLQKLNFEVIASGDSYNDLGMLKTADYCMLFNPPDQLTKEYPDIPVARKYSSLLSFIENPSS